LAKPYQVAALICESAKTITQARENIRRIKVSLAKLEATTDGLKADLAESNRLISESKAILAGLPPPEPVIPLDVTDEWLMRLALDRSTDEQRDKGCFVQEVMRQGSSRLAASFSARGRAHAQARVQHVPPPTRVR
jgi:hypothetical protein